MSGITPFPDQTDFMNDIKKSWSEGNTNVLGVASTGFGKTLVKAFISQSFIQQGDLVVIFAHRDVLLSQISKSLGDVGLPHKFICSKSTERQIGDLHVDRFGYSYISETANIIVASVLTWVKRDTSYIEPLIKLWLMDESHHLTKGTTWHNCIDPLVNSLGLGVTATPLRADKQCLGRNYGGAFDDLVEAIPMGELIERGRLSPYRIYTVPSNLDISNVNVTNGGDYNQKKLAAASDKVDITGDAVEHYLRLANGQQAITFCVNIEHAKHVAEQFNAAGINSFALSSKTPMKIREQKEGDFRRGLITNLINVNLFQEGYDVPACSVVIMLRKTMSYGLFMQMFGRMLRVFEGKDYGILLDHVGNVAEHCIYGAPHDHPEWSLEPPKKKRKQSDEKGFLSRTCPECFGFYQPKGSTPVHYICPYCKHAENESEINAAQRELQIREGTLVEYDNSYLTGLLAQRDNVDLPVERVEQKMQNAPAKVRFSAVKNHLKRQDAQRQLRVWVQNWCHETATRKQLDHETTQTEFARIFGVDVFKAQVLSERLSLELLDKIKYNWSDHMTLIDVVQ